MRRETPGRSGIAPDSIISMKISVLSLCMSLQNSQRASSLCQERAKPGLGFWAAMERECAEDRDKGGIGKGAAANP